MTDKPIAFTDEHGDHKELIVGSHIPRSQCGFWRYATPDDLSRAGYEPPLTIRGHIELLQRLGYFVENPKAADSEVRALRARVKELEAAFARLSSALESQQAAREEQELLEAVKAVLIKRNAEQRQYVELQLSLGVAFGEVSWKASDKFETFPTLSALLHAILKEEEKNVTVHEGP